MKLIFFLSTCTILLFINQSCTKSTGNSKRNLLSGNYKISTLREIYARYDRPWKPYPEYRDREAWKQLPDTVRKEGIRLAEEALKYSWPSLPASQYLEFSRNGNRSNFEGIYFERREKLADLLVGELIMGEGKYIDQIINGVWAICEETSWCIPAHISSQKNGYTPLPLYSDNVVDLFASETGSTLAWVYYFLEEPMGKVTPVIPERIIHELDKRILTSVRERNDYWWMGLGKNETVNNWNPWIISNWINIALIAEKNEERKARSLEKALLCLDSFLNQYPDDGGCDEGPGYWGKAGGALFDCLESLYSSSQGKINIYNHPLVKNIGSYIARVYIHDRYFINFADASAITEIDPDVVYRYGKRTENPVMMSFASFALRRSGYSAESYIMGSRLNDLFSFNEISQYPPSEPLLADFWLPETQVFGARSKAGTSNGLYLAGLGGHNAESHNHNDVGNFIIYFNGNPVIIDAGVGEYRRETFSAQRYSIWTMQSQYHNLPTINGVMQKDGREFRATDVSFTADSNTVKFSLNIGKAYPAEAGIRSWKRNIIFQRGKTIEVEENYSLSELKDTTFLTLMTCSFVNPMPGGRIELVERNSSAPDHLEIIYDPEQIAVKIEKIKIDDSRLNPIWGDELIRIKLILTAHKSEGKIAYMIKPE